MSEANIEKESNFNISESTARIKKLLEGAQADIASIKSPENSEIPASSFAGDEDYTIPKETKEKTPLSKIPTGAILQVPMSIRNLGWIRIISDEDLPDLNAGKYHFKDLIKLLEIVDSKTKEIIIKSNNLDIEG